MLLPKIVSSKAIVIFNQNSTLNITVSLHFDSHFLFIRYHYMTKKVKVLASILFKDVDKDFDDVTCLETGKFVEEMIDA